MNTHIGDASPLGNLTWSCVEDGFYVASYDNRFLGFVDRISVAVFQVCDSNSQQVGLFATLESAQDCLVTRLRHAHRSAAGGSGAE